MINNEKVLPNTVCEMSGTDCTLDCVKSQAKWYFDKGYFFLIDCSSLYISKMDYCKKTGTPCFFTSTAFPRSSYVWLHWLSHFINGIIICSLQRVLDNKMLLNSYISYPLACFSAQYPSMTYLVTYISPFCSLYHPHGVTEICEIRIYPNYGYLHA